MAGNPELFPTLLVLRHEPVFIHWPMVTPAKLDKILETNERNNFYVNI